MILRRTFLGAAAAAAAAFPMAQRPILRITPGEPLFLLGEEALSDHWNIQRFPYSPQKLSSEPLIRLDRPWEGTGPYLYGSVLRDPADKLWKCWYTVFHADAYREKRAFPYRIAYATSRDGQQWHKPSLGLAEHGGSRENNLVSIGVRNNEAIDVCLAPPGSGSPARFLGLTLDRGVRLYTSDDGLRWQPHATDLIDPGHSDCHNSLVWDARRRRWLVYLRPPVYAGPSKRRIAVMESEDLKRWTRPETVVVPEENDTPELYSMPVFQRGNLFFGFLQIYDRRRESLEVELTYSADGQAWHRLPSRPVWLPVGPAGAFDSGMVTTADDIVLDGDRMLVYYGGWNGDHKSNTRTAGIGCAAAPLDRFIGWRASGPDPGFLLTRPCVAESESLFVNAAVNGRLAIAVCDDAGVPLPGFGYDDFREISGDSVRHRATWKKPLAELRGRTVRLRVRLTNGVFFAFES